MNNSYDSFFKNVLSHKFGMAALLKEFATESYGADFDLTTLKKYSSDFASEISAHRLPNLIWHVQLNCQNRIRIFFIIEVTSLPNEEMPIRVGEDYFALLNDLRIQGFFRREIEPVVLPIVFYTGTVRWQAKRNVGDLYENMPQKLKLFTPSMPYTFIDVHQIANEQLKEDGIISTLIQYLRAKDDQEFVLSVKKARRLVKEDPALYDLVTKQALFDAKSKNIYLELEGDEIDYSKFSDAFDRALQIALKAGYTESSAKNYAETCANAFMEGYTKGFQEVVLLLLKSRFETVPDSLVILISKITDRSHLKDLQLSVYNAKSLDEFKTLLH